MMKNSIFFLFMAALFVTCKKTETGYTLADLIISKAEMPDITTISQGITARVQCRGPNSCYQFSHFEILEQTPFQYNIFAKAKFPKKEGTCLMVIVGADTSLTIRPAVKGQYILRFHNVESGTAFIADTIQVN